MTVAPTLKDAAPAGPAPVLQRVRGRAAVTFAARPGGAKLVGLHQSGSAKAFLPRIHADAPEVVFLNTAGGLTGGDRMNWSLDLADDAIATGTTQTAERAYAARPGHGPACSEIDIRLGAGARLDWLPQETILYQHSALRRHTRIDMAAGASLLYAETVILGRAAMGEIVDTLSLDDRREVRVDGVPLSLDVLRLRPGALAPASGALLGEARALATVLMVGPDAEDRLDAARRLLPPSRDTVRAAASAWDGKCIIRLAAPTGWPLRKALARLLAGLRQTALPRVWQI